MVLVPVHQTAVNAAILRVNAAGILAGLATVPLQVVDADNCALWDLPYAERACPAWSSVVVNQAIGKAGLGTDL